MTVTREVIVAALRGQLEPLPAVLAMWLEGADATGSVDRFSDIDLCCSVQPGTMDAVTARVQSALERLGKLDLIERSARGDDFQYTVYHLQGTSPYLLVDLNIFVGRGSQFVEGDPIERPLILFDRGGVIRFSKPEAGPALIDWERLKALADTTAQYSRIEKYILRGDFLEAFGYYHKWLLAPLIEVLRMRYTPLHPDYYIVHISRHLPAEVVSRLEDLFKISSLAELETKSRAARAYFEETAAFLRSTEQPPRMENPTRP